MSQLTPARLHLFFRQVSESLTHACMLGGSVEPTDLNQWVMIGLRSRQSAVLQGDCLTVNGMAQYLTGPDRAQRLFELLETVRVQAKAWPDEKLEHGLPMAGGLAGCLGYGFYRWCDVGWRQEQPVTEEGEWPELILCEFEDWLLLDLETARLVILTESPVREASYWEAWHAALSANIREDAEITPTGLDAEAMAAYVSTFDASFSQPAFENAVERLKGNIRNGEIYQANLSIRLQKELNLDPYRLFERLCHRNPSPFSGFFKWPGGVLVCNSPERLVQVDESGKAQARPIAGTRGRGKSPEEDAEIGETLLQNEKERAEHLMLVDLARNDLGRVSEAGSVQVDELLVLERYSHVTHLVSNVTAQLRSDCTGWDLLRSIFPCGTITGCPKIRCVEILNAVEPVSRGFYTGSLGYMDAASGAMDFNILIRSLFLKSVDDTAGHDSSGGAMRYNTAVHIGAGIVHDAVGGHEYRECLRKAAASLNELHRLETGNRPAAVPPLQ